MTNFDWKLVIKPKHPKIALKAKNRKLYKYMQNKITFIYYKINDNINIKKLFEFQRSYNFFKIASTRLLKNNHRGILLKSVGMT